MGGQKIQLTGVIYQPDGRTPAADVVLYYYHTNAEGRYIHDPAEPRSMPPNELGQTHGAIRGWVKTGTDGRYAIHTIRPGAYPSREFPAHVHATIKEPGVPEYYIDDFVFDDDPLLRTSVRLAQENRCGSGVVRLIERAGVYIGERDLILGLNIPGHPASSDVPARESGRKIGEDVFSFTPTHDWGPDNGSRACPTCKYGWYSGVLYFVGNHPDWPEIKAWLRFLEDESAARKGKLKVYFVYGNETGYSAQGRALELERLGRELSLVNVALTFVPSLLDQECDIAHNRLDPAVRNTMIVYRRSRIVDKLVDAQASQPNFDRLKARLDASVNEYFDLPK